MSKGRILKYIPLRFSTRYGRRPSAAKPGAFWHLPAFLLLACTPEMLPEEPAPAARKTQIYINAVGKASLQDLDLLFAFFRELLGSGTLFGVDILNRFGYVPNNLVILPPFALILLGCIVWVQRSIQKDLQEK